MEDLRLAPELMVRYGILSLRSGKMPEGPILPLLLNNVVNVLAIE